jgi:carboxyl-terminal processing protease
MKKNALPSAKAYVFFLFCGLLFVFYALNFVQSVSAKEATLKDKYYYLKTLTDVLALVDKNYVEPVRIEELIEGAVNGMLGVLDPHTSYMNKDINKELQVETKGQFGGLGIEITVKDGFLTVVSPIEDSPAFRAGVRAGDKIVKIEEEFTKNMSLIDAVKKMRGPKGSPVKIAVQRNSSSKLIPITIVRDVIKVKSVRYRMLEEGYGYVRLAQFQDGSGREFKKAVAKLTEESKDKKLKGLILDLRNNPGGLLTEAIRVSDLFLKEGVIVYTDGRLESQKQRYPAHDDGSEPVWPIIVLINGGSASASEIVAGALQDHERALVLGEQSFGKGSVQTILPMERGDALRLTTALYFTKSGRSIQAQGITPDVIVSAKEKPSDAEELLEEDEPIKGIKEKDLPGALKNPDDKGAKDEAPGEQYQIGSREAMTEDLGQLLKEDPQLAEALRLLKTLHIFKGRPTIEAREKEGAALDQALLVVNGQATA